MWLLHIKRDGSTFLSHNGQPIKVDRIEVEVAPDQPLPRLLLTVLQPEVRAEFEDTAVTSTGALQMPLPLPTPLPPDEEDDLL